MEVLPYITRNDMCLTPLIFIPSDDNEILGFELFSGVCFARLRGMEKNTSGRIFCVVGRSAHQVCCSTKLTDCRSSIQEQKMLRWEFGNQIWLISLLKCRRRVIKWPRDKRCSKISIGLLWILLESALRPGIHLLILRDLVCKRAIRIIIVQERY